MSKTATGTIEFVYFRAFQFLMCISPCIFVHQQSCQLMQQVVANLHLKINFIVFTPSKEVSSHMGQQSLSTRNDLANQIPYAYRLANYIQRLLVLEL